MKLLKAGSWFSNRAFYSPPSKCFLKNKSIVLCFFYGHIFFVVEKFFSVFFSSKYVGFFLYHASESQVLQFYMKISGFIGTCLINLLLTEFPHNVILLLEASSHLIRYYMPHNWQMS